MVEDEILKLLGVDCSEEGSTREPTTVGATGGITEEVGGEASKLLVAS